jgi:hypothetical protein
MNRIIKLRYLCLFLSICLGLSAPLAARAQSSQVVTVLSITNTPNASTWIDGLTNNALSFTWTNAPASQYQVLLTNTLAGDAANLHASLNTNLPSGWTNYYIPGSTLITIVSPVGTSQTNGYNAEWAYAYLQTNTIANLSGYDAGGLIVTNNGVTLSASLAAFYAVAPTNAAYTPSLATLQSSYTPGYTGVILPAAATTNGFSIIAGSGVGLLCLNSAIATPKGYGAGVQSIITTNTVPIRWTWLGGTNIAIY